MCDNGPLRDKASAPPFHQDFTTTVLSNGATDNFIQNNLYKTILQNSKKCSGQ